VSGPWRTWRGGRLDRYIRLDLTLYPGSSGGLVLNAAGQALGIATSALSRIAGLAIQRPPSTGSSTKCSPADAWRAATWASVCVKRARAELNPSPSKDLKGDAWVGLLGAVCSGLIQTIA